MKFYYFIYIYVYIFVYIYIILSPKWENFYEKTVFFFQFYILCENFSKIGTIIKKIPNYVNDPLNADKVSWTISARASRIAIFRLSMLLGLVQNTFSFT